MQPSDVKINWPFAGPRRTLDDVDVHVWAAPLALAEDVVAQFALTLSADESERARRFVFERDRRRFVVGRGTLRAILGSYLEKEPRRIEFAYSSRGKPSVAGTPGLHFNVAHSGELFVAAITRQCPLGVDVEQIRPMEDSEAIANRFFSAREAAGLAALPASQKDAAFFNLWTRKEALLKATGEGLSESLNQAEVTFLAADAARVIQMPAHAVPAEQWTLAELKPAPGFTGAIAAPNQELRITCWRAGV